jgi:hypothetical protein
MRLRNNVLLLLALGFAAMTACAVLAQQVKAQAGPRIIDVACNGEVALDNSGRVLHTRTGVVLATIPGAIALSDNGSTTVAIACTNGDVFVGYRTYDRITTTLYLIGNALSGAPTPTTPQSWGQVKERYR